MHKYVDSRANLSAQTAMLTKAIGYERQVTGHHSMAMLGRQTVN